MSERPPANVADLLSQQAGRTPEATAVLHRDQALTYATLDGITWGLVRQLHDAGLRAGDVVALHLDDPLVHLVAIGALARLGVVSVAVAGQGHGAAVMQRLLARTGASRLLADAAGPQPGLQSGLQSGQLMGLPALRLHREVLLQLRGAPDDALRAPAPDLLHFKTSSGTTGEPKIVAASHRGMALSIAREQEAVGYPAGERFLTPVALAYDGPRRRTLACLAAGGTVVLPDGGDDVAQMAEQIERCDVRHFACVPAQAFALAMATPPGAPRFAAMRCLRLSAGPSEASLHALIRERLTPHVLVSYGCTELGPMAVAAPDRVARHPHTVGVPMPGVRCEVVDAHGQPLPPGTVGSVRLQVDGMPQAYHDDAEASARAFRSGWFHPGDLGRLDEQGQLFLMGRDDALMIMNGVNIYPAEIEQVLLSHPAVGDAVALPLRHAVLGERPVAAVALRPGRQASEAELLAFASQRLGAHRPHRVTVLPRIPRNAHGKVERERLRQALQPARPPVPGQLQRRMELRFVLPRQARPERLDAWLQRLSGAAPTFAAPPVQADGDAETAVAHAWLQRLAQLALQLMQAARIPAFEPVRVLRCRVEPGDAAPPAGTGQTWVGEALLPLIEQMPEAAFEHAFQAAQHLATRVQARSVDDAMLQEVYTLIDRRIVPRLRTLLPIGKSTLPVLRVAHAQGVPFIHLGGGVFQLGWGRRAVRIERSVTSGDSAIGALLTANKALTASMLRAAGLPAPQHEEVATADQALAAAQRLGWPVVVKPLDRDRGEGVTVDVGDAPTLQRAFEHAQSLARSKTALVERQVDGICHRLFIAQGQLLYAVQRGPMAVDGDGRSSVAELVDRELAAQRALPPWERSGLQPLDELAQQTLARAGLTPASVPGAGVRVALRRIESTAWGGVDVEVTRQVHPENLAIARRASECFGLDVAGIDILSADIGRPWYDNGAVINEVNFAPLLGGAAISRSHIPAYLERLLPEAGRIPVHVLVGGEAAERAAQMHWRALVEAGTDAFLCTADRTVEPSGAVWRQALQGLRARLRALVLHPRVAAIVCVVQTDELLAEGWPLESVHRLTVVDEQLMRAQAPEVPLPAARLRAVLEQLRAWPVRPLPEPEDVP